MQKQTNLQNLQIMTEHQIQEILDALSAIGISGPAKYFLLLESSDSHDAFPAWAKLGHAPGHPEMKINSNLQALLFYWTTEFDWCTQTPIWESEYTELQYTWIQQFMNGFPELQNFRTELHLNLN